MLSIVMMETLIMMMDAIPLVQQRPASRAQVATSCSLIHALRYAEMESIPKVSAVMMEMYLTRMDVLRYARLKQAISVSEVLTRQCH